MTDQHRLADPLYVPEEEPSPPPRRGVLTVALALIAFLVVAGILGWMVSR